MDTMPHNYNLFLVGLSYLISVLGSFTALKLCRQHAGASGAGKWRSLLAGALAMGAGAIGALAIGRLRIGRGDIRQLRIEELEVGRLSVEELDVKRRIGEAPAP